MEDLMLNISVRDGNSGSRKKTPKVSTRLEKKSKRYQDKDPSLKKFKRPCNHSGKSFSCNNIKLRDIKVLRQSFYATSDKPEQDTKLSYMITIGPVERRRAVKQIPRKRTFNTLYHLTPMKGTRPTRVCLKFLTAALGVSERRVNTISKKKSQMVILKEQRGGDQISHRSANKKRKIIGFIGNLQGCESHYNRSKSKRIYLAANLNIAKLHKQYNLGCADNKDRSSLTMFSNIFRTKFNIGFSSPASDCCSLCTRLKHKIKIEKDVNKKRDFIMEYRIHNKRAKAFYDLTRETPPNSFSMCFDMQQVQPLPRTPINDAFYAQQVSFYVLCFVDMHAKHPTFYTWTEDIAGRGSTEVSSALLSHLDALDLADTKIIRLFSDGCGGQNKNAHVVHALYYWLKKHSPASLTEIHLTFPVRGHSFLPADRVFGRIEKALRKCSSVKLKEEYDAIYNSFGTVKSLPSDWILYDVKKLSVFLKKVEGILDVKRIVLKKNQSTRVTITCFQNFRFGTELPQSLLKKGKNDSQLRLDIAKLGRPLKDKKKKSLKHLLAQ